MTIYLPAAQMLEGVANYYVRTAGDPAAMAPAIHRPDVIAEDADYGMQSA